MITLSNIFSREKTLFYFTMWNDSDRLGFEHFLGHKVKNNLFIVPPLGLKGTVWYSHEELSEIERLLQSRLLDKDFESDIVSTLDSNWIKLKSYLVGEEKVGTADELINYYKILITWWSAMTTVFNVPDIDSAPDAFRQKIVSYRTESEKYTEQMNKIFVEFWNENAHQFKELVSVLRPEEAAGLLKGEMSENEIESLRIRLAGCFMYNEEIYPLHELEGVLQKNDISLEQVQINGAMEIKGRPAQKGVATGIVKIVRVKADMVKVSKGDILVTEMTNPDYVPYMKIAAAIVTDEGGTTCHAAIASRELKVPCIVGTKIATKVLKDGDLVEVDAEKGIVKILK